MCTRRATTRWASCPCDSCRRLTARTSKSARLGILPPSRSREAWRVIDALLAEGWNATAIASASDVALSTIDNAIRLREQSGNASRFSYGIAEKIIGHGVPMRGEVGAEGTRRRLRALAVLGWSLAELSERSGLHRRTLSQVRSDDAAHVRVETARAIDALYDELHMSPGPSTLIATDARSRGWVGPLGWDDIDDVAEVPGEDEAEEMRRGTPVVDEIAVARAVDGAGEEQQGDALPTPERNVAIEILARRGWSDSAISERLGVSSRTVLRTRHRLGVTRHGPGAA